MIAPPYYGDSNIKYNYNKTDVKNLLNKTSWLYEIKCNGDALLNKIWFKELVGKKVSNITFELNGLDVNADIKNCNLSGYKSSEPSNTDMITEEDAKKIAKSFVKNKLSMLQLSLGEPIIINKSNYNSPMYKIMGKRYSNMTMENVVDEPEIISDENSDIEIWNEYSNVEFVFPILINKNKVYDQYGNIVGLTLSVSWKKEVTNFDTSMVSVKLLSRKAKKLTETQLYSLIDNWWNSPYYNYIYNENGNDNTLYKKNINLNSVEKVYVMFTYDYKGKSITYISNWIQLNSDEKLPYNNSKTYSQVISDYVIWNTQNTVRY